MDSKRRKAQKDEVTSVKVELNTIERGAASFMKKSITQGMSYRQSLMKYAKKYGVSRASWKYNRNRSYICF